MSDLELLFEPLLELGTGTMLGVVGFYLLTLVLLLLWKPKTTLVGVALIFVISGFNIAVALAWLAMILPFLFPVAIIGLIWKKVRKPKEAAPVVQPQAPGNNAVSQAEPCGCYTDATGAFQVKRGCPWHDKH